MLRRSIILIRSETRRIAQGQLRHLGNPIHEEDAPSENPGPAANTATRLQAENDSV